MLDTHNVNSDGVEAIDAETRAKYEYLQTILRDMESVLVAYSGGVDSALLLKVAYDVLGTRAMGVIASSPAYAAEETEEALAVAEQMGIPVITVQTHELEDERYVANDFNRCYFCKTELFTQLEPLAKQHNLRHIAYGVNKDEVISVVTEGLRKIGYTYVTVDLVGYRTGSMNESFFKKKKA